jgi:hypothetical protein
MTMKSRTICFCFLGLFLANCAGGGQTNSNAKQQDLRQVVNLMNSKKITAGESYRRQREIARRYDGLDAYDEAYWSTAIAAWDQYDQRQISHAQAAALDDEANALRHSRRTMSKVAKQTECISERQRVSNNDYRGVNSTNGAVAIISLLGAVSDAVAVADACN